MQVRRPKMKNKIIEILKQNQIETHEGFLILKEVIDVIQDMEFPLTLEEYASFCGNYGQCSDCPILENCVETFPVNWDIDKITKAVRHEH
jgi:hypothetical protein